MFGRLLIITSFDGGLCNRGRAIGAPDCHGYRVRTTEDSPTVVDEEFVPLAGLLVAGTFRATLRW